MKTIDTDGIAYLRPVPGAASGWYYGIDHEHGDLYEAEEIFKQGLPVKGRKLCLVHYPDGKKYVPVPKAEGQYCGEPVCYDGSIYIVNVDFYKDLILIIGFDCTEQRIEIKAELPLSSVKDCYNLSLQVSPLTLTRQCVGSNEFEILWPEKVHMEMGDHDSFFLRDSDRLFFSRWHEEGDGEDYKYWEETVVRNLEGTVLETLPGDVMMMPNGEIWHLK